METDIIDALRIEIETLRDSVSEWVVTGNAGSYDAYCRATGKYEAFSLALDALEKIEEKFLAE